MAPTRASRSRLTALVACLALSSCAGGGAADETVQLSVWRHGGTDAEQATITEQVKRFNNAQTAVRVRLRTIPEGDYNDTVQTAAAAGSLPDVVELDGPTISSYVYQQRLVPLDGLVSQATLDDMLPSLQNQDTFDGTTYAVGTFDSGLGIYADRKQLEAAGVDWPDSPADAWTGDEFDAVLAALARQDADGKVLDVKLNYGIGEWLTYGFAPLVASAGGALIDPASGLASGQMDAAPANRALSSLRRWSAFVDPNEKDDAFVERRVPLSWVGHWMYRDYADALGDDLLVLPLPDLGAGSKTGQGSWAWAMTAAEPRQGAAAQFLEFLMSPDEVLRMADANGAVPGTRSALARSELYGEDAPLRIFADQLLGSCGDGKPEPGCYAVPRPATPAYPVLTASFGNAVSAALAGDDPRPLLVTAAEAVDRDIAANDGYR